MSDRRADGKYASQKRSRATVDALAEATARILVREGFDKTSNNRITKEALVAAVIDRHSHQLMKAALGALAQVAAQPVEKAARRLVAVGIEAHRIDPKLHRVLAEQIPRTGCLENVGAVNREAHALFMAYLERLRDELLVANLGLATFVCATLIEALTHTAVLHRPEILSSDEVVGTLIDEATRLMVGYLKSPR